MARAAQRAGRSVVIANSRGPESLTPVVTELGAGVSAGTPEQAAAAPIVVIAVPWDSVAAAVQDLVWDGQIVIDATNDWAGDDSKGRTSSELVAELVAGARVVKAANTLAAEVLGSTPRIRRSSCHLHFGRRRRREGRRRQAVRGGRVRRDRSRGTCRQAARCSRSTTRWQASTCSGSRADADRIDRLRSSDESVRLARGPALRTDAARLKSRRAEVPCWSCVRSTVKRSGRS